MSVKFGLGPLGVASVVGAVGTADGGDAGWESTFALTSDPLTCAVIFFCVDWLCVVWAGGAVAALTVGAACTRCSTGRSEMDHIDASIIVGLSVEPNGWI